ncbi:alpha/beta hydrolase family protein [Clostridium sp. CMCC3677]|uniref:alpha/beta hydrolase n=1 Tax=Clostridium sp. CMCC3677 TaxID=2949963 RepID=UPI0013F136D6|nr:alpha/beta hydrolase family protein [Clostridium sp. CMCC3677]NFG63366.1 esterase family protein [Clostridium botulinum]NFQ11117.1 esterase family protein [Clostridium botulinum]
MALITCNFYSDVLEISTTSIVIIPEQKKEDGKVGEVDILKKYPTLWLLHGLSDDASAWTRHSSIERYANERGIAVVMPQVHRSFYTDMCYGSSYWTFLTIELPKKMRHFFPLSCQREDNFVAGLSMGGYGAYKWAFNHPNFFSATASLSGVVDIKNFPNNKDVQMKDFDLIYGNHKIEGTKNDLYYLIREENIEALSHLNVYQCCGTEDFLYEDNIKFRDNIKHKLPNYIYSEGPGSHEWNFWDYQIKKIINWLPLK